MRALLRHEQDTVQIVIAGLERINADGKVAKAAGIFGKRTNLFDCGHTPILCGLRTACGHECSKAAA